MDFFIFNVAYAAQHGYHKKLQSICALFNQGGCASPCPKGLKHICSKVTDNDSMRMCYSDQHPLIEHQWSMNWWLVVIVNRIL